MDQEKIREGVKLILEGIGEDPQREGLLETPDRIARMYEEIAGGMYEDAGVHLSKRFHVDNNEMVVEKDITFYSLCEHHMLAVLRKSACGVCSRWNGSGPEQDRKDRRGVCQKTAAPGASDGSDRRCFYGTLESAGCDGHDRSRASVHDHERHQETGSTDRYGHYPWCF